MIDDRLNDPALDVDMLAEAVGLSRRSLFAHLSAEGHPAPAVLLRQRRLEKARWKNPTAAVVPAEKPSVPWIDRAGAPLPTPPGQSSATLVLQRRASPRCHEAEGLKSLRPIPQSRLALAATAPRSRRGAAADVRVAAEVPGCDRQPDPCIHAAPACSSHNSRG